MSKVFFDVGLSLDGYLAGANRRPGNPLGDNGVSIHQWLFKTATFLERTGASGGESSPDDTLVKDVFGRAGAHLMGRRMFDEGEVGWPENAPFRTPRIRPHTFTTRAVGEKAGTTFFFVTDGIASALKQAKVAAGGKDVRVSGGAETIRQFIEAGLIEEFTLHIAPVMLGTGLRLLDRLAPEKLCVEQIKASSSPLVTHITYKVVRQAGQ